MSLREDIRKLKTGPRELRKFGWLVGGVFVALGVWFLLRHKAHYPWCLWPGIALVLLGTAAPRALKWVYVVWMSLAFVLGSIVSQVILTLLFFCVITPIGFVARLTGNDFLRLKPDPNARSYWSARTARARQPADYEKQF